MSDRTVIVVERDWMGRPARRETYGPGETLPEWVEDQVQTDPRDEVHTSDPRDEVKHVGGPWYELPTGEKVRGKEAVREQGYNVK